MIRARSSGFERVCAARGGDRGRATRRWAMCGARRRGGRGARARARGGRGGRRAAHVVALAGRDGHGARPEDRPVGGEGRAFAEGDARAPPRSPAAPAPKDAAAGVGSDPLGRHPSQCVDGARSLCERRGAAQVSNRSRRSQTCARVARARACAHEPRARFGATLFLFCVAGQSWTRSLDRAMGCGGESSSRHSSRSRTRSAWRSGASRTSPPRLSSATMSRDACHGAHGRHGVGRARESGACATSPRRAATSRWWPTSPPRGCDFASTRGSTSSRTPPRRAEPPPPTSARELRRRPRAPRRLPRGLALLPQFLQGAQARVAALRGLPRPARRKDQAPRRRLAHGRVAHHDRGQRCIICPAWQNASSTRSPTPSRTCTTRTSSEFRTSTAPSRSSSTCAGETVYIPGGWPHYAVGLDATVRLTVPGLSRANRRAAVDRAVAYANRRDACEHARADATRER